MRNQIQNSIEIIQSFQYKNLESLLKESPELVSQMLSSGQRIPHLFNKIPLIKTSPLSMNQDFSFLPEPLAKRLSLINHLAARVDAIFAREVYVKNIIQEGPIKAAIIAATTQEIDRYAQQCAQLEQELANLEVPPEEREGL